MKPSRYFRDAHHAANQEFLGFSDEENLNFGADELPFSADDLPFDDDGFDFAADANPAPMTKPTSQPYIIQIENTTTASVSNVTILDAAQKQFNYVQNGVSITYGLTNISYTQFLASIAAGRSFKVGLTRISASANSSSTAESQVLKTFTITTSDINGNQISKPIVPQKDSYQQINNQVDIIHPYLVDSLTKLVFDTILGSTTVSVYLYPAATVNAFKELKGSGNTSNYGSPHVNKMLSRG